MTPASELIRLRQEVRESRADISLQYSGLLRELDFGRRFGESVRRHPLGWIGGAVSAGLLATLFGIGAGRKSPPTVAAAPAAGSSSVPARAAWIAGTLEAGRILYPLLRPLIGELLGKAARSGLAKRGRLR